MMSLRNSQAELLGKQCPGYCPHSGFVTFHPDPCWLRERVREGLFVGGWEVSPGQGMGDGLFVSPLGLTMVWWRNGLGSYMLTTCCLQRGKRPSDCCCDSSDVCLVTEALFSTVINTVVLKVGGTQALHGGCGPSAEKKSKWQTNVRCSFVYFQPLVWWWRVYGAVFTFSDVSI